ncbi:MAG TPA: hypothetical protein VMT81_01830 [Candidatus Paceibacterota bacterium]|nr:hypothetical protein [Candidatus Paceibacterota bacterium]
MLNMKKHPTHSSGQAILIAVLALGGAILGATAIAGLLMTYQVQSLTNSENSAAAIFAADSGVNWALYNYFQVSSTKPVIALPTFANDASVTVACYNRNNAAVACNSTSTLTAVAAGSSLNSRRTFLLNLTDATTAIP